MAYDHARLCEITTLGTSAAAVATNGSSQKTYVRLIVLHNTHTSGVQATLHIVPDSGGSVGTVAAANRFYSETLAVGDTREIAFALPGLLLTDLNDTIQGLASVAGVVTVQAYGGRE